MELGGIEPPSAISPACASTCVSNDRAYPSWTGSLAAPSPDQRVLQAGRSSKESVCAGCAYTPKALRALHGIALGRPGQDPRFTWRISLPEKIPTPVTLTLKPRAPLVLPGQSVSLGSAALTRTLQVSPSSSTLPEYAAAPLLPIPVVLRSPSPLRSQKRDALGTRGATSAYPFHSPLLSGWLLLSQPSHAHTDSTKSNPHA